MKFSRGEENVLEQQIKSFADAGINVVVSGGKIGDMALHYLNKYDIMGVRLTSKFDVRRISKAVNAVALPRLVSSSCSAHLNLLRRYNLFSGLQIFC